MSWNREAYHILLTISVIVDSDGMVSSKDDEKLSHSSSISSNFIDTMNSIAENTVTLKLGDMQRQIEPIG